MPTQCRVIRVTNVAPNATKEQMKTLFGFIGKIDDIVLYPESDTTPVASRVCFVKYEYADDVGVSLHLSNTVFIDRALIVGPVPNGKIPDEKSALESLLNSGSESTEVSKADEISRTVYVSNLTALISPEQILQFFGTQAGEVKYVRMAGDEGFGARAAFIEFSEQSSVTRALSLTGQSVGECVIRVVPANTPINKPAAAAITSKDLEQAMKKVNEAQPLISAVLDPDRKSRSRSRSRRSRSHRSRSKRSRSKSRRRSRSRSHRSRRRSRSRSKHKSRSPRRRKSRSRSRKRHSRSKSRDRRRRSKSPSPKSSKSRRSRSREKTKKTDSKSRDNTPAESSRGAAKRSSDAKKSTKESEKEYKQSSRHRSRSPKAPSSRKRSRSRSNSQSRSGRKGREERRRSQERSRETSSRAPNSRDDTRESDRINRREHNGHDSETDRDGSDKAAKRSRDADQESDVDNSEPKLARTDEHLSEGDDNHSDED